MQLIVEKESSKTSPTREGCAAVRTGRQEQPLNLYWVWNGIHVAGGKGTVVSTEVLAGLTRALVIYQLTDVPGFLVANSYSSEL